MRLLTPIENRGGGWYRADVRVPVRSTNGAYSVRLTWRGQRVRCCRTVVIADGKDLPAVVCDAHGSLAPRVRQCGGCGSTHSADFGERDLTPIEPEYEPGPVWGIGSGGTVFRRADLT